MQVRGEMHSTVRFGGRIKKGLRKGLAIGAMGLAGLLATGKPAPAQTPPPSLQKIENLQKVQTAPNTPDQPPPAVSPPSTWSQMDDTAKIITGGALLMAFGALAKAASLGCRGWLESRKPPAPKKTEDTQPKAADDPTKAESEKPDPTPAPTQDGERTPEEINDFLKKMDQDELRKLGLNVTPEELRKILEDDREP